MLANLFKKTLRPFQKKEENVVEYKWCSQANILICGRPQANSKVNQTTLTMTASETAHADNCCCTG